MSKDETIKLDALCTDIHTWTEIYLKCHPERAADLALKACDLITAAIASQTASLPEQEVRKLLLGWRDSITGLLEEAEGPYTPDPAFEKMKSEMIELRKQGLTCKQVGEQVHRSAKYVQRVTGAMRKAK